MKELYCHRCNGYLGKIVKGNIHKKAIWLCTECYEAYKTFESLANYKKGSEVEMPSFMEDLLKGMKK